MKMKSCDHSYAPYRYKEVYPEIYCIEWRCRICGKRHIFRTCTNWRNLTKLQEGRIKGNGTENKGGGNNIGIGDACMHR